MLNRAALVALLTCVAALAGGATAGGAVTTAWNAGSGRLEVRMTAPGDRAVLARAGAGLTVGGALGPSLASAAEVSVRDLSGGASEFVVDLGGGRFERPAGMRITIDLGADAGDVVRVLGEPGRDNIRIGTDGVNLTALEDEQADIVSPVGVDGWILEGRGGHDLLSAGGGAGTGTPVSAPVHVIAGPGGGVFGGGAGADLIEGGEGNDALIGGDGPDLLRGGGGSDELSSAAGDDVIENGAGPDRVAGGSGVDLLTHPGRGAVDIDLGVDEVRETGGAGADAISGIESVTGTPLGDRLVGGAGRNVIAGGDGADLIAGEGGDDELDGGGGNDQLRGGLGKDRVEGGPGRDIVGYESSPGGVSVRLGGSGVGSSSAAAGVDVLLGLEDVIGSPHNDALIGDAGPNQLIGGAGRDHLLGLGGVDALEGGAGNDDLESTDSTRDTVSCGIGFDTSRTDPVDAVDTDCEPARRAAPRTPKRPRRGTEGADGRRVRVLAVTYAGHARRIRVRLHCPAGARFACRGAIALRVAAPRGRGRLAGHLRYTTILSNRRHTSLVPIRRAVQRAVLRGRGRYKLKVSVSARDNDGRKLGVTQVRRVVPLRAARSGAARDFHGVRPGTGRAGR